MEIDSMGPKDKNTIPTDNKIEPADILNETMKHMQGLFPVLTIAVGRIVDCRDSKHDNVEELTDAVLTFAKPVFQFMIDIYTSMSELQYQLTDTKTKAVGNVAALLRDLMNTQLQIEELKRKLRFAGHDSYEDYLKSDHWRDIRRRALKAADYRCQLCPSDKNLNVHHRNYYRLGSEWDEDVVVLCKICHSLLHERLK